MRSSLIRQQTTEEGVAAPFSNESLSIEGREIKREEIQVINSPGPTITVEIVTEGQEIAMGQTFQAQIPVWKEFLSSTASHDVSMVNKYLEETTTWDKHFVQRVLTCKDPWYSQASTYALQYCQVFSQLLGKKYERDPIPVNKIDDVDKSGQSADYMKELELLLGPPEAQAFAALSYIKDRAVTVAHNSKTAFVYNEQRTVWEEGTDDLAAHMAARHLDALYDHHIASLYSKSRSKKEVYDPNRGSTVIAEDQLDDQTKDKIATLRNNKYKNGTKNMRTSIAYFLRPKLIIPRFADRLDTLYKDYMPVIGKGLPIPGKPVVGLMLDFRTGELRFRTKEDFCTKESPVPYDSETDTSEIEKMMMDSMLGNVEMVRFIQRVYGYALTGHITERCFFVLTGVGKNGKSLQMKLLRKILGVGIFYCQAHKDLFIKNKNGSSAGSANAYLADTQGIRALVYCESENSKEELNKGLVKNITGDDAITTRRPYDRYTTTFDPTAKGFFVSNLRPHVGSDEAMWDRYIDIYFPARFVKEPTTSEERKIDQSLPAKVETLAFQQAFFRWCVIGAMEWYRIGLASPESVKVATQAIKEEQDSITRFCNQCLVKTDNKNDKIGVSQIKLKYKQWCGTIDKVESDDVLRGGLTVRYGASQKKSGNYHYFGIRFAEKVDEVIVERTGTRTDTGVLTAYLSSDSQPVSNGVLIY